MIYEWIGVPILSLYVKISEMRTFSMLVLPIPAFILFELKFCWNWRVLFELKLFSWDCCAMFMHAFFFSWNLCRNSFIQDHPIESESGSGWRRRCHGGVRRMILPFRNIFYCFYDHCIDSFCQKIELTILKFSKSSVTKSIYWRLGFRILFFNLKF